MSVQRLACGARSGLPEADYLALPNVICVGGSWLTPSQLIAAHDWGAIAALAVTSPISTNRANTA